jgi:hypothetical protein
VPAIGLVDTRPSSTLTNGSGEDPASSMPDILRKNM